MEQSFEKATRENTNVSNAEKKYELITNRIKEIIGNDELKKLCQKTEPIRIYFGTSPTGKMHLAYLIPLLKIADFIKAGCEVKILIADLHAGLDNLKSTLETIKYRVQYYERIIRTILRQLRVPIDKIQFVLGSTFQKSESYVMDMFKLMMNTTVHDAKRAGAEVVKQTSNPKLGGLVYPILQALDEEYLGVEVQLGGLDQRKLATFALENMPKLGYKKRVYLMNPMLSAINAKPTDSSTNISDTKMSSSDNLSKIDFLDSKADIKKKISKAYCLEGNLGCSPLMELMKHVIFPIQNQLDIGSFTINRKEEHGGQLIYNSYDELENDFVDLKLHPMDLKLGIIDYLNIFLEPIKIEFDNPEMAELLQKAYP